MNQTFTFIIRSPQQDLFEGAVQSVHLATEGGELQCFANHASLTGTVAFSPVEVVNAEGSMERYLVRNGLFLFDNAKNTAVLLGLNVEKESEVSHQTVKEYMAFIEKQLAEGNELSDFQIMYLEGEKLAVKQQLEVLEG